MQVIDLKAKMDSLFKISFKPESLSRDGQPVNDVRQFVQFLLTGIFL